MNGLSITHICFSCTLPQKLKKNFFNQETFTYLFKTPLFGQISEWTEDYNFSNFFLGNEHEKQLHVVGAHASDYTRLLCGIIFGPVPKK